jgi:hypothetical protein
MVPAHLLFMVYTIIAWVAVFVVRGPSSPVWSGVPLLCAVSILANGGMALFLNGVSATEALSWLPLRTTPLIPLRCEFCGTPLDPRTNRCPRCEATPEVVPKEQGLVPPEATLLSLSDTVSETYYALRNVTMGIPPWPVAVLGIAATLLFPLLYQTLLIFRVILPQSLAWALGALAILIPSVLGVSGFVGFRLIHQRRVLCRQHVHMVRERFHLESNPLIYREISEIYDETQKIIALARSDLEKLVSQLRVVRTRFEREFSGHTRGLEELTRLGPSRSAIDAGIAEHFYETFVPDTQRLLSSLAESAGPVEDWLARCVESSDSFELWLHDQISRFGAQCLGQSVDQLTVVDALTQNGTRLEPLIERTFDQAYPMWNYDPRFIGRATQGCCRAGAGRAASRGPGGSSARIPTGHGWNGPYESTLPSVGLRFAGRSVPVPTALRRKFAWARQEDDEEQPSAT